MRRPGLLGVLLVTALGGCACREPVRLLDLTGGPDAVGALTAAFAQGGLPARAFDDHSLVISRDGLNVIVFVEDDGESLQAVLPCTRGGLGDGGRVAGWNAGRRFGRAYLDEDGRPVLVGDLLVLPSLDADDLAAWGSLMLDMAWQFVSEVWPAPSPALPPDPPNE
ncbi:MAG: YbjN domain-containing protein [Candidatus Krumholzibacteriia bacterium]